MKKIVRPAVTSAKISHVFMRSIAMQWPPFQACTHSPPIGHCMRSIGTRGLQWAEGTCFVDCCQGSSYQRGQRSTEIQRTGAQGVAFF